MKGNCGYCLIDQWHLRAKRAHFSNALVRNQLFVWFSMCVCTPYSWALGAVSALAWKLGRGDSVARLGRKERMYMGQFPQDGNFGHFREFF